MKIIDKQNDKYTKLEDFEIGDFFYDETTKKHYAIMDGSFVSAYEYLLICLETLNAVSIGDDIENMIAEYLDDAACLIKFNSDQVTMNFDRE